MKLYNLLNFNTVSLRHYSVAVLMNHILTRSHRILSKHKQDHNIPSIELRSMIYIFTFLSAFLHDMYRLRKGSGQKIDYNI